MRDPDDKAEICIINWSDAQQAVQVKPFERGNIRQSNSIEICSLPSTSPVQGHPGIEGVVRCEMMPRSRAELISRAMYNRPQRILEARI